MCVSFCVAGKKELRAHELLDLIVRRIYTPRLAPCAHVLPRNVGGTDREILKPETNSDSKKGELKFGTIYVVNIYCVPSYDSIQQYDTTCMYAYVSLGNMDGRIIILFDVPRT